MRIRKVVAIVLLVLLAAAAIWYAKGGGVERVLAQVSGAGPVGVVLFGLAYALAAVLFVPGSILTLGAGFLFGLWKGFLVVIVAATLGATLAFLIGRYLARDLVRKKVADNPRFAAIDRAVGKEGWKIVLLTRLSPIFPFNLLNYAFGLTSVRLRDYVLASFFGMMPGTFLYVYIGTLAGDLLSLGSRQRTPLEWGFLVLGLVATVAVTWYVTKVAKRALRERL